MTVGFRTWALVASCGLMLLSVQLTGCRPRPYAVATIVSWVPTQPEGRRCFHRCQSVWHHCAAECGSGSTSVVIGMGPVAFGQTRSSEGCRHHCGHAKNDCLRGCDGLEERVRQVRFCPDGPSACQEVDPHSPKLQLPLYCEAPDGQLVPCEPEPPVAGQSPEPPAAGQSPEPPAAGQSPEPPAADQSPEPPAAGQSPER